MANRLNNAIANLHSQSYARSAHATLVEGQWGDKTGISTGGVRLWDAPFECDDSGKGPRNHTAALPELRAPPFTSSYGAGALLAQGDTSLATTPGALSSAADR